MKAAAKELEFERAAALRDEIQQIRLRVLEEDASVIVGRAAERAAARLATARGLTGAADRARGRRGAASRGRRRTGAWRSRASRSCRPTRSRRDDARRRARRSTRTRHRRLAARASATSTTTTAAGRRAGSTGRPGTGPSRRTSSAARDAATATRTPAPADAARRRAVPMTADPGSGWRRRTKLVCTLGPATEDRIDELVGAGDGRRPAQLLARRATVLATPRGSRS